MPATEQPHTLSLIFTIAVVASIIIQLIVFTFFVLTVSKTVKKLAAAIEALSSKATPLVTTVRTLVDDLGPKVKTITGNIADISTTVREQTQHVNTTVGDVVDKTHVQVAKVDEMVSAVLGSIVHAGNVVQAGVSKPARQVNGVVQGVRAAVDSLFKRKNSPAGYREYVRTPAETVSPIRGAGADEIVEEVRIPRY